MAEETRDKKLSDLTTEESVDFLVRTACYVVPEGANPQDIVRAYENLGDKIKKAIG